jgi:transposase
MSRFVEGQDRNQVTLLLACLDDYIAEENSVRVVEAFISELDMVALGLEGAIPAATGRQLYHPAVMSKVYLYVMFQLELSVQELTVLSLQLGLVNLQLMQQRVGAFR